MLLSVPAPARSISACTATVCPNCGTPLHRTQSRRARLSLIGRVVDIDIDELLSRVKPERDFEAPSGERGKPSESIGVQVDDVGGWTAVTVYDLDGHALTVVADVDEVAAESQQVTADGGVQSALVPKRAPRRARKAIPAGNATKEP